MLTSIAICRWIGSWNARARFSAPLAARHLQDGHLVLYDITSSYFEGAYTQSLSWNGDGCLTRNFINSIDVTVTEWFPRLLYASTCDGLPTGCSPRSGRL